MRRALLVAAAAVAVAVPAGATAASSPSPSRLEAQITALQKQVKTLSTTVTTLKAQETAAEAAYGATFLFNVCQGAVMADLVQGTWGVVDQLSAAVQAGKVYFGPQAPIDDSIQGRPVCQALGVARSQVVPPAAAPFSALYALLRANPLYRTSPFFSW